MAKKITNTQVANIEMGNTLNINHPYHLNASDSPGMNIVNSVFDGRGFPSWRRGVLIALSAKRKLGFINGSCKPPDLNATDYEQWSCYNYLWLLNSLSKDIGDSLIYSKTAKELWYSLEHRFGRSNSDKLYHLGSSEGVSLFGPEVSSLLDPYLKLTADDGLLISNPTTYRQPAGKLNYLTHTRSDLSFVVLTLSQYIQHPREPHPFAALRVLRYLRIDPSQGILLSSRSSFDLLAFCDADLASCQDSHCSISGFLSPLVELPCPRSQINRYQCLFSLRRPNTDPCGGSLSNLPS